MSDDLEAAMLEMGVMEPVAPTVGDTPEVKESATENRNPDGTYKAKESAPSEPDTKADEASADAGESDKSDEQDKPDKKERQRNAQQRIGQLAAQRNAARAQVEALEAELRQYKPLEIDPNLEFEDPGRFTQASIKHALSEQRAEQNYAQAQQARQVQLKSSADLFYERVEAMRDEMPDFDQVFNDSVLISEVAVDFLADSEAGPRIAHHLGKNPSIAYRIANLNPVQQAVELTRLEAKFSSPPAKRTTQAPAPAPTIRAAASAGQFDPRTASIDDIAKQLYGKG